SGGASGPTGRSGVHCRYSMPCCARNAVTLSTSRCVTFSSGILTIAMMSLLLRESLIWLGPRRQVGRASDGLQQEFQHFDVAHRIQQRVAPRVHAMSLQQEAVARGMRGKRGPDLCRELRHILVVVEN